MTSCVHRERFKSRIRPRSSSVGLGRTLPLAVALLLLFCGLAMCMHAVDSNDGIHLRAWASSDDMRSRIDRVPESLRRFIQLVPKAELHVHIEGTLEPEMMLELAARNGLPPPYPDVKAARAAYHFSDLQSFLDLYYFGCSVLRTRRDFYDLATAYFKRAVANSVVHAEVFFDPQTHIANGLEWDTFMGGLTDAAADATAELGLTISYIMCFRKDLSEQSANDTLTASLPWVARGHVVAVGLDSSEMGNPPSKFQRVYDRASRLGLLRVAHAGEEGPPEYVWEALELLHVRRVDHGVHSIEDPALMAHLNATRTPLTVCPISNLKLKVYDGQLESRLTALVRSGLLVTINSDDAAYFGAYAVANYEWVAGVADLSLAEVAQLAVNSFEASFFLPGGRARRRELAGRVAELAIKEAGAGAVAGPLH